MTSFNKIWSVTDLEINSHLEDFQADGKIDQRQENIYAWPSKGNPHFAEYNGFNLLESNYEMADFKDFNGDGIYNPDDGDYPHHKSTGSKNNPAILHYTVFHHLEGDFRAEFGLHVWAWDCPDNRLLHSTLFASVRVVNRSAYDWQKTRICIVFDPVIGCYEDDYFGSVPSLNASFCYNSDFEDGENESCLLPAYYTPYRFGPPVQSMIFLNKRMDFLSFCYSNTEPWFPSVCPNEDSQYFHLLNGRWGNGQPIQNQNTGEPSLFAFPDPPFQPGSWWEGSAPQEPLLSASIFQTTALEDIKSGEYGDLDLAFVYHHLPGLGHEGNVELMYEDLGEIKNIYDSKFDFNCSVKNCINNCVWPGDTNDDGIVDYLDAIPIFRSLGNTGTIRNDVFRWRPQTSEDWSMDIPGAKNSKYCDADGNGKVDLKDLELINIYLHQKHGNYVEKPVNCDNLNQASLRYLGGPPIFTSVQIYQMIASVPFESIQGISFSIKADASIVDSLRFTHNRRQLGAQSHIYQYHTKQKAQKAYFSVHFSESLQNFKPDTNIWGNLTIIRKAGITPEAEFTTLELCDVLIYFADGTSQQLGGQTLNIPLKQKTNNYQQKLDLIRFYPNPTNDLIYFEDGPEISKVKMYNFNAHLVKTFNLNFQRMIEFKDVLPGLYYLEIVTKKGTIHREKLMIIK